ncbi:MAG: FAD-binding protein, partial [Betaproteobacteria bacterium]|nr:FAD-binding protein [Betaproteobacteria bacterium]
MRARRSRATTVAPSSARCTCTAGKCLSRSCRGFSFLSDECKRACREFGFRTRLHVLRGGGSKDFYGEPPQGEPLDTRDHAGIVDYDPSELVITARCGTPLAEIEAALAERGQMLAFEPPHFGGGATFGGMVAAGLSGPRRQAAGAVRDFVLGVRIMDARGEVLRFGGQVMKN